VLTPLDGSLAMGQLPQRDIFVSSSIIYYCHSATNYLDKAVVVDYFVHCLVQLVSIFHIVSDGTAELCLTDSRVVSESQTLSLASAGCSFIVACVVHQCHQNALVILAWTADRHVGCSVSTVLQWSLQYNRRRGTLLCYEKC